MTVLCISMALTHFEDTYTRKGNFPKDTYLEELLADTLSNAVYILMNIVWRKFGELLHPECCYYPYAL